MAKREGSTYQSGSRTDDWLKIKTSKRHDLLVRFRNFGDLIKSSAYRANSSTEPPGESSSASARRRLCFVGEVLLK